VRGFHTRGTPIASDGHTQPGDTHALNQVCAQFMQDASPYGSVLCACEKHSRDKDATRRCVCAVHASRCYLDSF